MINIWRLLFTFPSCCCMYMLQFEELEILIPAMKYYLIFSLYVYTTNAVCIGGILKNKNNTLLRALC